MNPLIVIDAAKAVPDPFALAMAAAARARALRRGAPPRSDADARPGPDLALCEIASSAFAEEELAPFLPDTALVSRLAPPKALPRLGGGRPSAVAATIPPRGTFH